MTLEQGDNLSATFKRHIGEVFVNVYPDTEMLIVLIASDGDPEEAPKLLKIEKPLENGNFKYHLALQPNASGPNFMQLHLRPSSHTDKFEQAWVIAEAGRQELANKEPNAILLRTGGLNITNDKITEVYGEEVYRHADMVLEALLKTHSNGRNVSVKIDPYV